MITATFPVGTVVSHAIYGDGKIKDVEGTGNDEKVTIVFMDGSQKKVFGEICPLVKIEE